MSTYRSRLEAGIHPRTDPRRDLELLADLRRLAEALTPRWRPTGERDDVGSALLRIGARLAEQSTQRLDESAQRDALAFFDFLGLPPDPPRAATGVLVLALEPKHTTPVQAPVRTQVAVTTGDQQATFETQAVLRVVPGGIDELLAVDPAKDHIERSPAQVTSALAPPVVPAHYRFVTFSGAGNQSVQLSPASGLAEGDLLRIGDTAYRVEQSEESGLVTLVDTLVAPAPAGTDARRITSFETFTLQNLQEHRFYVGHTELLNLEREAGIDLELSPVRLAAELAALDIEYSLYGTRPVDGVDLTDWHPLEVLGTRGAKIRLAKTWIGPADEWKIQEHTSRWIRARLRQPITDRTSPLSRATDLRLTVASAAHEHRSEGADSSTGDPETPEGSRTVVRAAHNGTPLATTRRFYPFGPAPIRFDTFALAAPEALSKTGASVTLDVNFVDSSLESFGVAVASDAETWKGFGVGRNGKLTVVADDGDRFRWLESMVVDGDGQPVPLSGATPTAIATPTSQSEVVIAADRAGRLWSGVIRAGENPPALTMDSAWLAFNRAGPPDPDRADTLVAAAAPIDMADVAAVVLDVSDRSLYARPVDWLGKPGGEWGNVRSDGPAPELSSARQITPVQGAAWPQGPTQLALVALSDDLALWVGVLAGDAAAGQLTATWTKLAAVESEDVEMGHELIPPARMDVTPAASWFLTDDGEEQLWICFASKVAKDAERLHGIVVAEADDGLLTGRRLISAKAGVAGGSVLHTNPRIRGEARLPTVVGLESGRSKLLYWQPGRTPSVFDLRGPASSARPQLVQIPSESAVPGWEILVAGEGERLLRVFQSAPQDLAFTLHDPIRFRPTDPGSDWAPDLVEIATDLDDPSTSTLIRDLDSRRRIYVWATGERIFEVSMSQLADGKKLRFLRLRYKSKDDKSSYQGEIKPPVDGQHPDQRTRLQLATEDRVTKIGRRVVMGEASYKVESVDEDRVATLNTTVVVTSGNYFVADRDLDSVDGAVIEATAARRGTLVKMDVAEAPEKLDFGPTARPRFQQVELHGLGRNPVWGLLEQAWEKLPETGTKALVVKEPKPAVTSVARVRDYQNPELSWEYFDGEGWQRIKEFFSDGTAELSTSGKISFVVPPNLTTTEIGGKKDYWIRARLIGGDYGRPSYVVTTTEDKAKGVTTQTVVADTTDLNPPEILSLEASFHGPVGRAPEVVLVENNAEVLDQTQAAALASASFELFQGAVALDQAEFRQEAASPPGTTSGRALFAGLTGQPTAGPLTLLVDAVDQSGEGTLLVDVLTPEGWRRVPVDDRTASLRRTGMITLSLPDDPVQLRLFGQDRVWLRFRPGGESRPIVARNDTTDRSWAPNIRRLLPNAVPISHARTMENEVLGSSLGAPGTTVNLSATPVLPDSVELRVREDLSAEERTALDSEHGVTAGSSPERAMPTVLSGLDAAPGTWVRWRRVDSLIGQKPNDRVYVLEPASGKVTFGDGRSGRIPPAGRDGIRAFSYQQGGGTIGNVPAWTETRMTTALEGVETAVLPLGVAGGADTPAADSVFATAPQRLRHAGRALTPADVEALTVTSSGDILRARCRRPERPGDPIHVAVVVRDETSRHPEPTHAQREAVAAFIRSAGWGGLDGDSVEVTGPAYVPLAVTVVLVATPERWAEVEDASRRGLIGLFDPAHGGPHGTGWPFGRRPDRADLLRVLHRVGGIDRVASIDVTRVGGARLGELTANAMVCAEAADISVTVRGEGSTP